MATLHPFQTFLEPIGNWNPQAFRELKGKLTRKNLALTLTLALVTQGLFMGIFLLNRPTIAEPFSYRYCGGDCELNNLGVLQYNHSLWCLDLFVTLGIGAFFLFLLGGVYLLLVDISKEQKQGTLNFIRLSPQSSDRLFLGKILGVPSLIYLFLLTFVPLHLWSAIGGGVSVIMVLGFYSLLGACGLVVFKLAVILALATDQYNTLKAWLATGALFYLLVVATVVGMNPQDVRSGLALDGLHLFIPLHFLRYGVSGAPMASQSDLFTVDALNGVRWFGIPLFAHGAFAWLAMVGNYLFFSYFFDRGIQRRFYNPEGALIPRKQSYGFMAGITIALMGFACQTNNQVSSAAEFRLFSLSFLMVVVFFLVLVMVAGLMPSYQELQDWSSGRTHYRWRSLEFWQDLATNPKSPIHGAILIHSTLSSGLLLPFLWIRGAGDRWVLVLSLVLLWCLANLAGLVAQTLMVVRWRKRRALSNLGVVTVLAAPFLVMVVVGSEGLNIMPLFLVSFLPMVAMIDPQGSGVMVPMAILGEITLNILLLAHLQRRLPPLGASQTRRLLAAQH